MTPKTKMESIDTRRVQTSFRLDPRIRTHLERLAEAQKRTVTDVVEEALKKYLIENILKNTP